MYNVSRKIGVHVIKKGSILYNVFFSTFEHKQYMKEDFIQNFLNLTLTSSDVLSDKLFAKARSREAGIQIVTKLLAQKGIGFMLTF